MVNKELVEKIQGRLKKGEAIENIRMSLLNSNYSLKELEEALDLAKKLVKKPTILPVKKPIPIKKPIFQRPKPFMRPRPLMPAIAKQAGKGDVILFILLVLVFLSSFGMHFKISSDYKKCKNQVTNLLQEGPITLFGITLKTGNPCDEHSLNLWLLKVSILISLTGIIYTGYILFKKT